jgi:hypothetical protein
MRFAAMLPEVSRRKMKSEPARPQKRLKRRASGATRNGRLALKAAPAYGAAPAALNPAAARRVASSARPDESRFDADAPE